MPVINRIAAFADDMADWRRWLHRNPELGFDLPKTAAFVAERLREIGVDEIHEGIARTGIVAIIEGQGPGDTVGLRADMDALPIAEATGADWASETPGRMHACGHDGHTAMLLGAARYLAETRRFRGRVALIFQPAEEEGGGGGAMVEEGLIERFGIREVYALHNDPGLPEGMIATCPGLILAGVDDFRIKIRGRGGHAAYPDTVTDPVLPAAALAQALLTVPARDRPPREPLVVAVTELHAGSATNVVPETAEIAGTVRSFDEAMRTGAEARLRALARGIAEAYGVEAVVDYRRDYPATVNDPGKTAFAATVAREIAGDANVREDVAPKMGAEDFAFMLNACPGTFLYVGQGTPHFCHHPAYDFNDRIAPVGASLLARLAECALALDGAQVPMDQQGSAQGAADGA